MSAIAKLVRQRRERRHRTIRKRITGTSERPRLNVFRSGANIYAQVIDDGRGHTLAAASSLDAPDEPGPKTDQARAVGRRIAKRAREVGVTRVVFDRGGYLFHGRIKALADSAREGGLEF